ncbi:vacuolar protein 14 C-terminal Fig4p binding-domain-containing protein [Xylogone sp. PMI_703]|nr:vacuolar protein 14 C-terminal Fig4p binding-domain-containing protein [Xylogone sp. PMI_703]
MDPGIQRALNDKLYDKRKVGALELERAIRQLVAEKEFDRIKKIIQQLCNEYAYAVHQPHARNGGLIGLAAAAIALGPELARYLDEIVPPVLACFTDQDARVRYYACESMYNIAKLGADSELSVKNGAELLDRLIKDIVSESAATYVSILQVTDDSEMDKESIELPTAFSLARFIPLLKERIHVLNPFTRTFLVGWITLLDSIPDLELVSYLPEFLGGLFKFLSDTNRDVQVTTRDALERFLNEIKRIARVKKGIDESRKSRSEGKRKRVDSIDSDSVEIAPEDNESGVDEDVSDNDWIPGQDVEIHYKDILVILTTNLDSSEEECLLESLRWILEFLDICPEEVLPFTPTILEHLLPAMASTVQSIRDAAAGVNTALMDYVVSLSDDIASSETPSAAASKLLASATKDNASDRRDSSERPRGSISSVRDLDKREHGSQTPPPQQTSPAVVSPPQPQVDLDYAAAVSSLTLLFLNDQEATRVAALTWLLMLHRKAPRKVLAFDGTFPVLLKTLSDPAEAVVTRDLQLLSQISRNSEDDYFTSFMLLETRGNLIIRQLCFNLSAERIYRTLADCIEKEEDVEFASIMVQNLNNNLITAPELSELRKRLRNLETKDGQAFFVALFRSWCYNAVATFSLCLLAQAYEQAYNLLQIFAELEMTVNMLIQIDKLVQLLESPVFTYLRLQLLEPEKYPHLYKCLYGLLMLLPQSSAFGALKNRLQSVSAIGYLHIAPRLPPQNTSTSSFDRSSRLKGRDEGGIRWNELLEKFRSVQEKARGARRAGTSLDDGLGLGEMRVGDGLDNRSYMPPLTVPAAGLVKEPVTTPTASSQQQMHKSRSGLSKFGRLGGGAARPKR